MDTRSFVADQSAISPFLGGGLFGGKDTASYGSLPPSITETTGLVLSMCSYSCVYYCYMLCLCYSTRVYLTVCPSVSVSVTVFVFVFVYCAFV